MVNYKLLVYLLTTTFLLSGCASGRHGTFVSSTHVGPEDENKFIGKVIGESSQTWFLYVFPMGDAPSTDMAISNAKSKIDGTKFLTDISIDDRMYWGFGYSKQIIEVKASAYK